MKIILFRHGEKQKLDLANSSDKKDVFLTDLGIIQINKLGKILKERFPFLISSKNIYSSDYSRAIQSANIVKSLLDIKNNVIVPEFGEFIAYTNYQNSRETRQQIQKMAMINPNWVSPETRDSLNNFIFNFKAKITEILFEEKINHILVATHGGIIRNLIYSLDQNFRPSDELIAESKIHEAGYTVINFDNQKLSVDKFDVHDYL